MRYLLIVLLFSTSVKGQTIAECKKRFDSYLNFNNSLSHLVRFENEQICIYNKSGKKEFTAYQKELPLLAAYFENMHPEDLEKFYIKKGNKALSKHNRDSLQKLALKNARKPAKVLSGMRIAIDPGHLAGNFTEAMNEQKFLYFVKDSINHPYDSIKIFESELTFKTALLLKKMVEGQGGKVFFSRKEQGLSSFGISYHTWFVNRKEKVIDSLFATNKIDKKEHKKLSTLSEYDFFWSFFRDYELLNRARVINEYKPDLCLIIHYNVDEKNEPWKKTTPNNFTMAFIGGSYTADRLDKPDSKMNFLRMLFSNQINESERLSGAVVAECSKNLNVPIAKNTDALYLKNNCKKLACSGVFSRQLILCNRINAPLVYGESLYQDNEKECELLMKNTNQYYGIETNERVYLVAKSYYNAILQYLGK